MARKNCNKAMVQKLTVTAKTKFASLEPGLSQWVVRSTSLYLNPISGPRRTSELLADAWVRSITIEMAFSETAHSFDRAVL
jgi:hypothetical protein